MIEQSHALDNENHAKKGRNSDEFGLRRVKKEAARHPETVSAKKRYTMLPLSYHASFSWHYTPRPL